MDLIFTELKNNHLKYLRLLQDLHYSTLIYDLDAAQFRFSDHDKDTQQLIEEIAIDEGVNKLTHQIRDAICSKADLG